MSAVDFFARFKQIRAFLHDRPDASAELKEAFDRINAALKASYSPEAFKQALQDNVQIDSDLEDRITSTHLLMNRERARRAAGQS